MIGMILLVLAALFFYGVEVMQKRVEIRVVEASSAKDLVEHCVGIVGQDALLVIGRHGGFAELDGEYFERLNTSYLFDEGANQVPDVGTVEEELSTYIEQHLGACIDEFEVLRGKGITVTEQAQPKIATTLAEQEVQFAIDYPVEEHKGGLTTTPAFVPVRKAVRLKHILELADALVESEKGNDGLFDLDVPCALHVTHFPLDKTLVTVIADPGYLIAEQPYRFVFAHRR